ncbi:MAG: SRPBCC family protein [Actinomycetes bacterium]|jgi:ribosome-associated toxin RatA of RatAB toxin-antitoxin module|nr:SRPBCC family protein [Actinomycetes bacterium]
MADQTTSSITIDATPTEIMMVIADFAAYPDWTGQVKEAKVLSASADGRADQVRFVLDAGVIKDEYTLGYTWDDDREVRWTLVEEGSLMRALDGSYTLVPAAGPARTDVTYRLTVDTKIPMLGMIKRKAEKVIVDTALKELAKRVASQRADGG